MEKLDIVIPEDEIKSLKEIDWKKYKHGIINKTVFVSLVNENQENSKCKYIYKKSKMSACLEKI